jgi:positive regulator of sigma E activity
MKTNIVETGIVIHTEKNLARIQLSRGSSCKGCGMAKIGLCRPGGSGMIIDVENPVNAKVADVVTLGIRKQIRVKGYFLAYILPLGVFVLSAIVGYWGSEVFGLKGIEVVSGFLGLTVALVFSLRRLKSMDRAEKLYIKRVVENLSYSSEEADIGTEGGDYLRGFKEVYDRWGFN